MICDDLHSQTDVTLLVVEGLLRKRQSGSDRKTA